MSGPEVRIPVAEEDNGGDVEMAGGEEPNITDVFEGDGAEGEDGVADDAMADGSAPAVQPTFIE